MISFYLLFLNNTDDVSPGAYWVGVIVPRPPSVPPVQVLIGLVVSPSTHET